MGKPSGAHGSAPGQKFWVFKFFPVVIGQQLSVYLFSRLYDTGKCFTQYFVRRQGPLAPPLTEISGFLNIFLLYSYRAINSNHYTDFHASTIPGSVLHHYSPGVRGPWLRPWTEIFGFRNFSFGLVVNRAKFQFPRPSGSALEFFPMLNLWGSLQGPLTPPLGRNFGFLKFSL